MQIAHALLQGTATQKNNNLQAESCESKQALQQYKLQA